MKIIKKKFPHINLVFIQSAWRYFYRYLFTFTDIFDYLWRYWTSEIRRNWVHARHGSDRRSDSIWSETVLYSSSDLSWSDSMHDSTHIDSIQPGIWHCGFEDSTDQVGSVYYLMLTQMLTLLTCSKHLRKIPMY